MNVDYSLDYFGNRRTDTNVSSKFQGVETASQIRYVTYYERLKKMNLQYPVDVSVTIKDIRITGSNAGLDPIKKLQRKFTIIF